jgi:hypothetical protein
MPLTAAGTRCSGPGRAMPRCLIPVCQSIRSHQPSFVAAYSGTHFSPCATIRSASNDSPDLHGRWPNGSPATGVLRLDRIASTRIRQTETR